MTGLSILEQQELLNRATKAEHERDEWRKAANTYANVVTPADLIGVFRQISTTNSGALKAAVQRAEAAETEVTRLKQTIARMIAEWDVDNIRISDD